MARGIAARDTAVKVPEFQTWTVTEPYLDLKCSLGEGPHYEPTTNNLRFVDIIEKRIHTIDLTAGPDSLTTLQLDMPVGVTQDIEGIDPASKILAGGKSGVYVLDRKTGDYTLIKRFHDSEENDERLRSNDGAVDAMGRLWIGTMNDFWVGEPQPEGHLFRFTNGLSRDTIKSSLTIPNSIGWSPDNKTMYFTHTTESKILAYDYNLKTGEATNERVFYHHEVAGHPDGFKIDVEGNLWQTLYAGSKVLKISPEGKVIGEIVFPEARNLTCPAFAGTDLWVTSAKDGESKYGGGLFKVNVGVRGLESVAFKIEQSINGL